MTEDCNKSSMFGVYDNAKAQLAVAGRTTVQL